MTRRSEKPQSGNPHQLVLKQHVFSAASIQRFTNEFDRVEVADLVRSKTRFARVDDKIFCADRAWSSGSDTGWMKTVEDDYQSLASSVAACASHRLTAPEGSRVGAFFALWQARAERRNTEIEPIKLEGILGVSRAFTPDDIERLEKHGIHAIRPDGSMAGRDMNDDLLKMSFIKWRRYFEELRWGVIRSDGEFVIPDTPVQCLLPVTPHVAFISEASTPAISQKVLAILNRNVAANATNYLFAHSISDCPGIDDFMLRRSPDLLGG